MKWKLILLVLVIVVSSTESDAQTRRRKRETKKEKLEEEKEVVPFTQKLAYDIRLGTPSFGSGFAISLKPSVGYKLHDRITVGLGGRFGYELVSLFDRPDPSLFDYGGFTFARLKIGNAFYIQGEYNVMRFENLYTSFEVLPTNVNYPAAGIGYMNAVGDWSYGIELTLPLSEVAREYGPSFDYMLIFSYRF